MEAGGSVGGLVGREGGWVGRIGRVGREGWLGGKASDGEPLFLQSDGSHMQYHEGNVTPSCCNYTLYFLLCLCFVEFFLM